MLIGMLGVPASGKTTIASKMFSYLKENATPTELIIEQARYFIAESKFNQKMSYNDKLVLSDRNQQEIAIRQFNMEKYMKHSCSPNTIIISDSTTLNAGLYMSLELYENLWNNNLWYEMACNYDILFYCHPIIGLENLPADSNRIHDSEQIKLIQNRANNLLSKLKSHYSSSNLLTNTGPVIYELPGTLTFTQRFNDACSLTLNKHCEYLSKL